MKLLQEIFSIKNTARNHKQICVLGLKIKIKRKKRKVYTDKKLYHNLPIQNNKIVFRHSFGSYACNVKYITEEILKQKLPYELVWIVNKNILKFIKDFPEGVRLVMAYTPENYKEYATAKIFIDSERRSCYIKKGIFKREGQFYIQTFHGSLGIKKTGEDRNDVTEEELIAPKIDASQIDYLISNGTYTTEFFKRMFWNHGKILETGHPRNDIFFKDNTKIKEKVYNKFNIPKNKKILLYAPTLREDKDLTCYNLDFNRLQDAISKKFNSEYVILIRLHPLIIDLKDKYITEFENIIDATDYSDMQELLAVTDILITDYSSSIYDFIHTKRPGFIFATDAKKYDNDRGLYYPLTSTPFPVASNNDELISNIEKFNYTNYLKQEEEFLKGKGCIDDGHASERVVELIKNIIENASKNEIKED